MTAGLIVHRADPLNCETSISALIGGVVMPSARAYVRSHFPVPALQAQTYRLAVGGLVERPLELRLQDVRTMPIATCIVTMECAGNGRALFDPPVEGEPWSFGAVSTAEWTGVPLRDVLRRARVRSTAREVVFRGADAGSVAGRHDVRFERSLALDDPVLGDALLAYAMNGEPLPPRHGYPLRLVVPGWYGVASVKWLIEIELVDTPFRGYYQLDKYWYEWPDGDGLQREPVTLQRPRAVITEPSENDVVERGAIAVRGVAWSGSAPIAKVDVAIGDDWREARLVGESRRSCWQRWEYLSRVDAPGRLEVSARATDHAGATQPVRARWNRHGYGNNSMQRITVDVV